MTGFLFFSSTVHAGDLPVKWIKKSDGSGFVNENRLPPGAKIKARVVTLDDNKTPQPFEINGVKFRAKKSDDIFTGTVDSNGNIHIKHILPNVAVPALGGSGNDLRYGIMNENSKTKAVRWSLILNVIVSD